MGAAVNQERNGDKLVGRVGRGCDNHRCMIASDVMIISVCVASEVIVIRVGPCQGVSLGLKGVVYRCFCDAFVVGPDQSYHIG